MLSDESQSFSPIEVMAKAREGLKGWVALSIYERLLYVRKLRKAIVSRSEQIIEAIQSDTQRTPIDILSGDLWVVLDQLRYYEKKAAKILAQKKISSGSVLYFGKSSYVAHEPLGVVLILGPWNYPFQLSVIPVVSALIAGNSVILKPSEVTPQTTHMIAELFIQAGFPKEVFQVVEGGPEVGETLICALPDKICVTGSSHTGKCVARLAADHWIPTVLELGGKDAMVVLEDAPLERAVQAAVYGAFMNSGQTCVGIKRIYVHRKISDLFLTKMIEATDQLRVGIGFDADLGPLVREKEKKQILDQVDDALTKGAKLHCPAVLERTSSRRLDPILLTNVPEDARLRLEESFGPVVWLENFDDENEAIHKVNGCSWKLSASVWSRNLKKAQAFAKELDVGSVVINDVIIHVAQPGVPFGGEKRSGWGRTHGEEGLLEFVRKKSVTVSRLSRNRQKNWFPYTKKTFLLLSRFMKYRFGMILLFLGTTALLARMAVAQTETARTLPLSVSCRGLQIAIQSIPTTEGHLAYAIFSSPDGFPEDYQKAVKTGVILIPAKREVNLEFKELPCGSYSLAVYHDRNDNQKLDKNFLGIPTESIGFSRNPIVRFGPPSFQNTEFKLSSTVLTRIQVVMIH